MANNIIVHSKYGPLDLRQTHLGRPDIPFLWEILLADKRPVGKRELICGEICRQMGRTEWMHVYERQGLRIAAHQSKEAERRHHSNESDEHKAYKERTVRVAESAGFSAEAEARAEDGKIRTDVLIAGATGPVGFEIQRSFQSPQTISKRDRLASERGHITAWHTDQRDLSLRNEVPWTRTDNLTPSAIADGRNLLVRSGIRSLTPYRCDNTSPTVCPVRTYGRCGSWHVTPEVLVLHYDEYVRRVASGLLVKLEYRHSRRANLFWTPIDDRDRYGELLPDRTAAQRSPRDSAAVAANGSPTCTGRAEPQSPSPISITTVSPAAVVSVARPEIQRVQPRVCWHGVKPCGKPARLYPSGWRCDDHSPSALKEARRG